MTEVEYHRIVDGAARVSDDDWTMMESYAIVVLSVGSGARHKEVKEGKIEDLCLIEGDEHYHIAHPKGEDSYGEERDPPIRSDCVPFLRRYMKKHIQMNSKRPDLENLFPAFRATRTASYRPTASPRWSAGWASTPALSAWTCTSAAVPTANTSSMRALRLKR